MRKQETVSSSPSQVRVLDLKMIVFQVFGLHLLRQICQDLLIVSNSVIVTYGKLTTSDCMHDSAVMGYLSVPFLTE